MTENRQLSENTNVHVVHDYFSQWGGAERVVKSWVDFLGPVGVSALTASPTVQARSGLKDVSCSFLNRVPAIREDPRLALPLLPYAARRLTVAENADWVLISTSAFAHGVRSPIPRVTYWHTPPRWLYIQEDYRRRLSVPGRLAQKIFSPDLRRLDMQAAMIPSVHLCNSRVTQERLLRIYGVRAEIVYPPVSNENTELVTSPSFDLPEPYFLVVGRSRGYKNIELVCSAAEMAGVGLVVVGRLPKRNKKWPSNIIEVQNISDAELRFLYRHAEALVSASREDFGLTPVEANMQGTPAICLKAGGFLETIEEGRNGLFFEGEEAAACRSALEQFRGGDFSAVEIRESANRFSSARHFDLVQEASKLAMSM